MKPILLLALPVILYYLISISCGPRNPSNSQRILGKWKIELVIEKGKDVTDEHNPAANRWIKFNSNHTFQSDGDPFGPNTGKWTIDFESSQLYLDSDAGVEDDSYWSLNFDGDKMIWKGLESDFTKKFELHFNKD